MAIAVDGPWPVPAAVPTVGYQTRDEAMIRSVKTYIRANRRRRAARSQRARFDAVYYLRRYPDLAHFSSVEEATGHYRRSGEAEGRFPNAIMEEEHDYRRYIDRSDEFDLAAYKVLNPDLIGALGSDKEFILHYIRHGRREGRPATYRATEQAEKPLWLYRFSVSQFSAWASDWMDPPADCDDAMRQFETQGVERLAPIRFDHLFDPAFYRAHYREPASLDDVALYRSWLDEGLPRGRAPSEARLLLPYIGEAAFPACFDWQAYTKAHALTGAPLRAAALIHLFEQEKNWNSAKNHLCGGEEEIQLVLSIVQFKARQGRNTEADAVLRAWDGRKAEWPATMWRVRGEAHAAIGQVVASRDAYEHAIRCGETSLKVVAAALRANLALQAFEPAFDLLRSQRERWLHKADFERLVDELIERVFAHASAEAHAALSVISENEDDAPKIARINDDMTRALALIVRAIEELEVAPAHLGARPGGHIALLGNEDLRQCRHYRIEQKQAHLERAGFEVRRHSMAIPDRFHEDLVGAQAAIFYRLPATPVLIRAILTARRMGIPTYYDIDDLIFCHRSYPPSYESYQSSITLTEYRGLQFGVPLFRFAMSLCDRAIASTPALLKHMLPVVRTRDGFLLRNALDWRNEPMIALGARPFAADHERIRIFYGSGTLAHNADFTEIVSPALARLMDENDRVDLVLIGHVPYDAHLRRHPDRVLRYPFISNVGDYWSVLSICDVNIAPLVPEPATDAKSEIKWLEAAALAIPTVASGTQTYQEVIRSHRNGFIADTTEQWFDALSRLCSDAELRAQIGLAARQKALADYGSDHNAAILKKQLSLAPAESDDRLRVLVCNVFFAPQSIGGATRVVESNVADIARHAPDIKQAIFCTDEGIGDSGRMRTSHFGDVPVFRAGIRQAEGMDHKAFGDDCIAAFRKTLDLFDPQIVHFHCIQRLTASLVRECMARRIPYLVTVHDAWWISPHQFLVDEDGILRLPHADLLHGFADNPDRTASILQRRRALDAMLVGAERVIAVSESFADIYRSSGIASVIAIPNGVSDLPPPRQPDGLRKRLRLALIGGRASHKGADLVEAALRLGQYGNLHLLLIDGRLAPGEHVETHWGATSVTISAPFPQGDVASLYGEIDVLLAPSRWPESFGLVAREAAHFGLWVVASDLGAIGEDIVEGENGYRIDTTDRRDLDRILKMLDDGPDYYRQGTARWAGGQRTAHQQAKELAVLYRSVLGFPSDASEERGDVAEEVVR